MGLGDIVQTWLLKVALRKAIVRGIQVALAFLAAHQADMATWGITLHADPVVLEGAAIAAIASGLEIARNWTKVKYPKYFSWL